MRGRGFGWRWAGLVIVLDDTVFRSDVHVSVVVGGDGAGQIVIRPAHKKLPGGVELLDSLLG